MKAISAIVVIGTAFIVAWTRYRLKRWEQSIQSWEDELLHAPKYRVFRKNPQQSWDDLPVVVHRYLRQALQTPDGEPFSSPTIQSVQFSQEGLFKTDPSNPWTSFTAEQVISANPPGFVWDASVAIFPSFPRWPMFQVCDAWTNGHAALKVSLLQVLDIPVLPTSNQKHPEHTYKVDKAIESGEAMRWMAEIFMVPTALLPGQGLFSWSPVISEEGDMIENQARLHLSDPFQPLMESLVISFDEKTGLPYRAEGYRPKWVHEKESFEMTDWVGYFEEYHAIKLQETTTAYVPSHWKVGWIDSESKDLQLYFDGFNRDLEFHLMEEEPRSALNNEYVVDADADVTTWY